MSLIRVDDIQMAYTDTGVGRPIVLLHGYPFNRTLWNEQVAALSSSYRIIVPDLRGSGESDASPGPATMNHMAQDVAQLLDHLEISRAVVGGLSMGGYVTLAFYKQFPSRVRALVLADTRAQADTEEAKNTRAQQAEKALSEGMAGIADAMLPELLTPETVSKRPEIVKRVRDMMLKTKPEGAASALLGMAERDDQTDLLSKITAKTLIIVGAEDALTPVADSEKMHSAIAGSRLAVLENAGHVSNLERTAEFNEALMNFFERLDRLARMPAHQKFSIEERVRWGDVDAARIIFYGAYIRFFEIAETELFRAVGLHYGTMFDEMKIWLPRVHLECDFRRVASLDDLLEVSVYVGRFGTKSMRLNFEVRRRGEAELVATAHFVLAAVNQETFETVTIPSELREKLAPYAANEEK